MLPITTVNEHWAFVPASAHDTYPVMSCGTGMTVLTYQLLSLPHVAKPCFGWAGLLCSLHCVAFLDSFLVLKLLGRRKSPKTVNIAQGDLYPLRQDRRSFVREDYRLTKDR